MENLITRMVSMETVWRQCGEGYFKFFYSDSMMKIVRRLSAVFMEKTWKI